MESILVLTAAIVIYLVEVWKLERERAGKTRLVDQLLAQLARESDMKHKNLRALQNRVSAKDYAAYSALQGLDGQLDEPPRDERSDRHHVRVPDSF